MRPDNPATGFRPPSATVVSAEPFFPRNRDTAVPAEENGDLQTLICVLVARPRGCHTLSNPVPWQNWMAAYLGYTLRMQTLFRGWPIMGHGVHTRRRSVHETAPLLTYNGVHLIAAHYSFIDSERIKGWVGLVGWSIVDGLPTYHKWSPSNWLNTQLPALYPGRTTRVSWYYATSLSTFQRRLKTFLFRKSFPDIIADWHFSGPCGNLELLRPL